MTKAERRKEQLERHYKSLEKLASLCGVENPNGKKLSTKLFVLEQQAHRDTIDWSDNYRNEEEKDKKEEMYIKEVQKLFNNNLEGLFLNLDARGYALKIHDSYFHPETGKYKDTGLHTDWGRYGILGPNITGD